MLQEIGDVLQAPKNALWSAIGLHDDAGNALSGSQVAHNVFGTNEDSVWGKALGFGLDVAGDPLTWAAPLLGKGVGAAGRALGLFGEAAEAGAGAAKGANALEKALAGGIMSSPEELSAIGSASRAAGEAAEQGAAAFMSRVPPADLNFVAGSNRIRQPLAGALPGQAKRYNALRDVMGDALEEYGVGDPTVDRLRSAADQMRGGLLKKSENQRQMFYDAAAGHPAAQRGAAKMSHFRDNIAKGGLDADDLRHAYSADEAIMNDFRTKLGTIPGPSTDPLRDEMQRLVSRSVEPDIFGFDAPGIRTSSSVGRSPESPWMKALAPGSAETELSPLMNARRNVGVVKDFTSSLDNKPEVRAALQALGYDVPGGGSAESLAESLSLPKTPNFTGRLLGEVPSGMTTDEINAVMNTAGSYLGSGRSRGIFSQTRDTANGLAFLPPGASPQTSRHEIMHALINRAQQTGDYSGIGPIAKAAAYVNRAAGSESGFVRGIGSVLDEMAGHAAEGKGSLDQLSRAAGFLFDPRPAYVKQFAAESPLVAAMYQYSPYLGAAGLTGATAGAATPFMRD